MRIGVCDDNKGVREMIRQKVQKAYPGETVSVYESGAALLAEQMLPDILFLDIKMPPPDGMQTARKLRERSGRMVLIFVTVLKEYVFEAFDVGAFHYLLKPFSDDKFAEVLKRAVEQCGQNAREEEPRAILVKNNGMVTKVALEDVIYAEVFNRKVMIHTAAGHIEYYGRLADLAKQAGEDFFRTHRAYLVNLDYVEKYNADTVWLTQGQVPVSKKQFALFVRHYMKYISRKKGG